MDSASIKLFADQLEDELCRRTDIDSFEEFMTGLAKELSARYLVNTIGDNEKGLRKGK